MLRSFIPVLLSSHGQWKFGYAIFISCGALRSIEIIDELEQLAGKAVITSNQAMAWDVMRLAGIQDRVSGYGRLLG